MCHTLYVNEFQVVGVGEQVPVGEQVAVWEQVAVGVIVCPGNKLRLFKRLFNVI